MNMVVILLLISQHLSARFFPWRRESSFHSLFVVEPQFYNSIVFGFSARGRWTTLTMYFLTPGIFLANGAYMVNQ